MKPVCAFFAIALGLVPLAEGQTYTPLGSWTDPAQHRFARLMGPDARPQLAGLRPKPLELLTDAALRKVPSLRNNRAEARKWILKQVRNGHGPKLLGTMAEATVVQRNPEWRFVSKSNATQHDVYCRPPGRQTPQTGQVKFHASGKPALYARDMQTDYRAHRFFVPDDHVEGLKAYLRTQGRWRDLGRVQPYGATSTDVRTDFTAAVRSAKPRQTGRFAAEETHMTYVSLGATLALAFGPTIHGWATGNLPANVAQYQLARGGGLIGVGLGAEMAIVRVGLAGTARGNALVGTAIAIVQTTYLLSEYGWQRAFTQPVFYGEVVGGVSAVAVGTITFVYVTAWTSGTGPFAPFIGVLAGAVTGGMAHYAGNAVTRAVIELVAPEMLRQAEREWFTSARAALDHRIRTLESSEAR
jgi:hypothetical protein